MARRRKKALTKSYGQYGSYVARGAKGTLTVLELVVMTLTLYGFYKDRPRKEEVVL